MTERSNTLPTAVKLALIYFVANAIWVFVLNVVCFQWNHYIICGSFLVEDSISFLLLWCAFRAMNWARWFIAILTVFEVCFSPFVWVSYHQIYSFIGAVWFWLSDLLDILAVIALFHSSSNQWFRSHKLSLNTTP